ncbi:16S rRNA (guanine(527)-N(7))-methyltransferase RsmG [Cochlodiniinecator piscidefendens]|uniref:16S rRNA (guanine(527)-N(7))-methyltransferase RsmG n=1 Tax=Cochlodiniinecator piscidefendens TaxID=2715756 RepID=UPI001408EC47|nr:16S rRNA (guanine(527)-N(7))-methyltransferase RsmG [Cochlodiniinecator piscidefendens]
MNDIENVSRETLDALQKYVSLVEKWNPAINLVSKKSVEDLWERHILDSVQIYRCAEPGKIWVDIGSGGGFPGIVAAIMAKTENPNTKFVLIESDLRKGVFLKTVIRELNLKAEVITNRIEKVQAMNADIVSARALANLNALLSYVDIHLAKGGTALLPKGISVDQEIADAKGNWQFQYDKIQSKTDSQAFILKVKDIVSA